MELFSCWLLIFLWYGTIPVVLSRPTFSVISKKLSQDLTFIRRMPGAVNEKGFRFSRWAIYISFSALSSTLTCRWVSLRRGGFYSIFPAVTSTVGIFPVGFLIRRFCYTFVNRFWNFHTPKHVNRFLKWNRFSIKALYIGLFRPNVLEEGNLPHPRCPRCNILVPCSALNRRHLYTDQWSKGVERKRRRLVEEDL